MNKKVLNLPILISLVVGNMIGTGIYVLPASLASYGTASLWSWIFTSLGAIFIALTFAHLNRRFPQTGGPYVYCKEAFGSFAGYLTAYTYWASNLVSISGIAVSSIAYLGFLLPTLNANSADYHPLATLFTEIGIVWFFTIINIIGLHTAGIVQIFLTIIKITPLLLITFIGLTHLTIDHIPPITLPTATDWPMISSAAALTFWAFIGLEAATIPAENTHGTRDIYRATVYGTIITSSIYILSTFVLMALLPLSQLQHSQFPFADAAVLLFGGNAASLITICAVISGFGALNVCILIQGQIVFAAARDHLFPKRFAKLSKNNTPIAGQLLSSSLITFFLVMTIQPSLMKQFNYIALLAGLLTLATYFATTLAEIKFILQGKRAWYTLFLSRSLWIAIVAAIYASWMISNFDSNIMLVSIGLIAFATPIYFLFIRKIQPT